MPLAEEFASMHRHCEDPAYYLITAPTDPVLSVDDCKTMMGISGSSQDGMITAALAAVISAMDPASQGWFGRALRPQTWEYRATGFPRGPIELDFPPLLEIVSVKYID